RAEASSSSAPIRRAVGRFAMAFRGSSTSLIVSTPFFSLLFGGLPGSSHFQPAPPSFAPSSDIFFQSQLHQRGERSPLPLRLLFGHRNDPPVDPDRDRLFPRKGLGLLNGQAESL